MKEFDRLLIKSLDKKCKKLEESCSGISVGIQTSANNIYHLNRINNQGLFRSFADKKYPIDILIEDKMMKPLLSGADIKRYQISKTKTYVLFPYEISNDSPELINKTTLKRKYPLTWDYLKNNEIFLRSRESSKMNDDEKWWAYNYPKNLLKQSESKLVIAGTAPELRISIDIDGTYVADDKRTYTVHDPSIDRLWFLLGVLNSPVVNYIFKKIARPKANGYFDIEKQYIKYLPIPICNKKNSTKIAKFSKYLQDNYNSYEEHLIKLSKRLSAAAMEDDKQSPTWIWSDLQDQKTIKLTDKAIATGLKGTKLTHWGKKQQLAKKLEKLAVRLNSSAKLSVKNDDGEITLLVDNIPAFDSVYVDTDSAPFIAAQWKQTIRTTNITPTMTAEKILNELLKLKKTSNKNLIIQILELDKKLDQLQEKIDIKEQAMNTLVYKLYDLTEAEIRQVEKG